jgi:hypothetical protein
MNWFFTILETVVFWTFVYVIVFMGCETPAIVFTGFGLFLFYWLFRFVASKQGTDKLVWIYVANLIVTLLLIFYFMTGMTVQKSIRIGLNSLARKIPTIEPLVKRC